MSSIFWVIIYLFLHMSVMWVIYRLLKNPSVVDVSWSLGLMVCGLLYCIPSPLNARTLLVSILLILWAFRLSFYLWFTRIRKGLIDKRYTTLSKDWTIHPALGFFLNFQFQGALIFIISSVFFFIYHSTQSTISLLDGLAACLIITGIFGESIADLQLYQFKKHHQNRVCNIGLWHYSRHPNYFFDWVTWVGFALIGLQSHRGYLALCSPFMLYLVFTQMTGPLTERGSITSKGQKYIEYQAKTPMFFPWIH